MSKAVSIHTICTSGKFDVKGFGEGYAVPAEMIDLYQDAQESDDPWTRGVYHNALQQMIITCRALVKRVKKDQEWSRELAEANLAEFKIKPVPVPKQEKSPEDQIADLLASGKVSKEYLRELMAR